MYQKPAKPRLRGFTLVELLVVIAIIGVLVGLLLPAVQSARAAARRTTCLNHMKQIGLAVHSHHDALKRIPAGWQADEPEGEPGWGWAVQLLPYMEETYTYDRTRNRKLPISAPEHSAVRETVLEVFLCPEDNSEFLPMLEAESGGELFPVARSNYVGMYGSNELGDEHDEHDDDHDDDHEPHARIVTRDHDHDHTHGDVVGNGAFFWNSRLTFKNFRDGLSKTILVGERSSRPGASVWIGMIAEAEENMARIVGVADHPPNALESHFEDFSSEHVGGAHFLFGDGSVRWLPDDIDEHIFQAMATRDGHDLVLLDPQ